MFRFRLCCCRNQQVQLFSPFALRPISNTLLPMLLFPVVPRLLEQGLFPDLRQSYSDLSSDQCRELFSDDFLSQQPASNSIALQPTKASEFDIQSEIDLVETFADALRFEENLSRQNRIKREGIFKRVLDSFSAQGVPVESGDFPLPIEVTQAMAEQDWKREVARMKLEEVADLKRGKFY
jgi:hypothetical protein